MAPVVAGAGQRNRNLKGKQHEGLYTSAWQQARD
jgi:hypothetical protein